MAFCMLDEDGFITLPDGSKSPVVVEPDGTAFIVGENGGVTLIGEGASFVVEDEDPASGIQYENAQGETPQAPVPPAAGQSG